MNEVTPKNNTMKIAVIILSILLVGSIGFIAYDKLIKKEEPKTEENNKQDKNEINGISYKVGDKVVLADSSVWYVIKNLSETEEFITLLSDIDVNKDGKITIKNAKNYLSTTYKTNLMTSLNANNDEIKEVRLLSLSDISELSGIEQIKLKPGTNLENGKTPEFLYKNATLTSDSDEYSNIMVCPNEDSETATGRICASTQTDVEPIRPVIVISKKHINNKDITSSTYSLEEAKKLVDKYYYNWGDWGDTTFEKMDDNDKMYLSYVHLNKDELIAADCKKLYTNNSNATSNSDGRYNVNILNDEHVCDSESKFISYEKINDVYKSLFGNSNNIPKKAFGLGFDAFDYVDDGFVKLNFYGGGDWPTPYIMYDVLSAKLTNEDKLTISVGYVEFKIATDPETVYSADFDSSITYNDIDSIEKDFVKKHSDKITKLEFNFKKENENFVLKSLEK